MSKKKSGKPRCKLVGVDGNVFSIIAAVRNCLKEAGHPERAAEFVSRAMSGQYSYDEILGSLVHEYVEPR